MEVAHNSNERTPFLVNAVASNGHGQLLEISTTSNEQTPLDGNVARNEQILIDVEGSTSNEQEAASNSDKKPPTDCPGTSGAEENEVSLEEVVQALCSAWKRHMEPNYQYKKPFNYKEIYAMRLAFERVTNGRHYSIQLPVVVDALADAMAKVLVPESESFDDEDYYINHSLRKNALSSNLCKKWYSIEADEFDRQYEYFPTRYTETIFEVSDDQPSAATEFWRRQVERYDKVYDFMHNPKFLMTIHSLLMIWHVSLLVIGSRHMDCSLSHHLPWLLILAGCVGCVAVVFRLCLMYFTPPENYQGRWYWEWISLRLTEFTFLILFTIQAYHFFHTYPTTELDLDNCVKSFYGNALVINWVSIGFVSVYILAYFIIYCVNEFDFWEWIIRRF